MSLLAATGGLWMLASFLSYRDAHRALDELFDAHLAQSAQLLSAQAGHELLELEELQQEDLQQYARHFAVQLWDRQGRLQFRIGPAPAERFSPVEQGFSDATIGGRHWRVFSDWDYDHQILVQMAEPHDVREQAAARIALNGVLPMIMAMPVIGVLIWWIVSRGLAPVTRVGEAVARRAADNLEPLDVTPLPVEVQPLAVRLNDLFRRIGGSMENERRFTADAAHELRNPVAAIRAQAEAALGGGDPRASLENIAASATRLSRLVDQLLALARLDARAMSPGAGDTGRVEVDLVRLTRQTLAELAPAALERGASIELVAPDAALVRADPALLPVVIRNLVDNAVTHGGPGAQVTVSVGVQDGRVALAVSDDGPGVAPERLERLGQRFFRGPDRQTEGSGLGLSIVARIAQLHGAVLQYDSGAGRGLRVTVGFPAV